MFPLLSPQQYHFSFAFVVISMLTLCRVCKSLLRTRAVCIHCANYNLCKTLEQIGTGSHRQRCVVMSEFNADHDQMTSL